MRMFVAGATGALGRRLVPLLVAGGHQVTAMTWWAGPWVCAAGAEPVVADALDRDAVLAAVTAARPEAVVHQLTDLAGVTSFRSSTRGSPPPTACAPRAPTTCWRRRGPPGPNGSSPRASPEWPFARVGGPVKTEDDPLDPDPPAELRRTLDAIRYLESAVLGPRASRRSSCATAASTASAGEGGYMLDDLRRRRFPVIGAGTAPGRSSTSTTPPRPRGRPGAGRPGIYQIVDDDPAPVSAWLPALAAAAGARPRAGSRPGWPACWPASTPWS